MKKLLFAFIIILFFSIALNGCSDRAKSNETIDTTTTEHASVPIQATFKLTLDDIKKRYDTNEIKYMKTINVEYVLVESQKETFPNRFDLYNLKTGQMDTLPTMPEYVSLEKVENENYFVFLSSGKNSESPFNTFPYLIKCFRIKNDINESNNFIAVYEDKYMDLKKSVEAGSKENSVMTDLNITFDGIEILFTPMEGNEAGFYAATTDIPPTKTLYDEKKRQITFEIGTNQLGESLKNKVSIDSNQYISSYEISQKDNKIYLSVDLKDTAKSYLTKVKKLSNGFPFLSVKFTHNK